jgi:hypothetical protein
VFRAKGIVAVAVALLVGACLYLPYLSGLLNAYGSHALQAPAYSLPHLAFMPQGVTIATALILCMLARFVLLLLLTGVILWCSNRVKNIT